MLETQYDCGSLLGERTGLIRAGVFNWCERRTPNTERLMTDDGPLPMIRLAGTYSTRPVQRLQRHDHRQIVRQGQAPQAP